jgi:hypothetical protein
VSQLSAPPCCAALLWLLAACGGHVGEHPSTGDGGVTGGVSGATPDEPTGVAAAGRASSEVEGGAAPAASQAGATSVAGAPLDETRPLIGSGTRYCENERYCFGLDCYAPDDLAARVCVAACPGDGACGSAEVCLESADLAAGCYRRCDTPFDCDYGFDCFDFSNQQRVLVCFPTPWASLWQRERR